MGADWGPVIIAVALFILLSPGLLFQLPARTRVIEFGNMNTSGIAILIHAPKAVKNLPDSSSIDVDTNGQDQNSIESEKYKSVNSYCLAVSLHTSKFQLPAVSRYLKKKAWR
ncbi:hypothetical protein JCGZ_10106 [Jatropha curcas]|uniref:Uncharacterized protein n=1 Tax=Jatropha curcas TaxID=180498 RepID=A0A067LCS8_JATCU|nr:hypothetical protein JCGZ_10106 [Jatropha curcas]